MKTLLTLIAALTITSSAWGLTMAEAINDTLRQNPQIARAAALVKVAEARTGQTRAPFWPTIGINYSYWNADRDPNFASNDLSSTSTYASYNLFNGGSDWFRHQSAKARQAAAQWQYQSTVADIILELRLAYIEGLRAEQNLDTAHKSLELLERQHRDAKLRLEQGLIARNDLLRIAVERATAQQDVANAKGALVVARQELARIMGKPLGDESVLEPVIFDSLHHGTAGELQKEMLAARSELKFLRSQLEALDNGRKAVYGDLMPDVDLSYSYDTFGNGSFPDSNDTDYEDDGRTLVQASWTLFSGFETRYELAVSKQEIFAIKEEIRATEDRLQVQLRSALEGHRTASTNLATASASVALAEENYRVNENRYRAQVATTVDLLDAQEFLTRARNEENKAQYDLYNAEAVIDRVLERNNPGRATSGE